MLYSNSVNSAVLYWWTLQVLSRTSHRKVRTDYKYCTLHTVFIQWHELLSLCFTISSQPRCQLRSDLLSFWNICMSVCRKVIHTQWFWVSAIEYFILFTTSICGPDLVFFSYRQIVWSTLVSYFCPSPCLSVNVAFLPHQLSCFCSFTLFK